MINVADCKICGVPLVGYHGNTRICKNCRAEARSRYNKEAYNRRLKKEGKNKVPEVAKCIDCNIDLIGRPKNTKRCLDCAVAQDKKRSHARTSKGA